MDAPAPADLQVQVQVQGQDEIKVEVGEIHLPPGLPAVPEPEEVHDDEAAAAAAAAAEAAAAAAAVELESFTVEENLKRLQNQQHDHHQLIMNMQSTIDNLSAKQIELEGEIRNLKDGRWVVRAEPKSSRKRDASALSNTSAGAMLSSIGIHPSGIGGTTEDEEIDDIIQNRKMKKTWPLKRKYCTSFTNEVDLVKVRFHRSDRHTHKSIRIPKVEKSEGYGLGNKEGRLICRLCSGKTINRNTSWMCGTCCVPLCVDIVNGDPESSCHHRWHACQDLVTVNQMLNTALRERRESKKRSRDAVNDAERSAEMVRQAAALANPDALEVKVELDPVVDPQQVHPTAIAEDLQIV
eukprot:CAMPEP_0183719570 /NCGR_PEP_ID=MMETSP0737-20130205/12445_1 /TAXON_ID=385413 /ORGANISM="Thalassiosira miniscula, Strain CCMP1093" /LENGTH=351 /DNA_ID=CAMNT_0025949291 /DNA_START=3 /DNA_END=1058 /DNA_ORIENTATION=+